MKRIATWLVLAAFVASCSTATPRPVFIENAFLVTDAVRIEQLFDYFRFSYAPPAGNAPYSITTEVAACPWKPEHRLLRIGLQGRDLEQGRTAPNDRVFLIDVLAPGGDANELTGALVTIAQDVTLQLELDPKSVASHRLIGYRAGHSVTALYELEPVSGARGRIGDVRLRYQEAGGEASQELVAAVNDDGKSQWEASADLQFAAAIAELGMIVRNSPHRGTASYADVLQLAKIARGADRDGSRGAFIKLVENGQLLAEPPMLLGG